MDGKNLESKIEDNPWESLKEMRNWSNEVPKDEIIREGEAKVRKNWWEVIIFQLAFLVEDKMLPEELEEETKAFIKKYTENSNAFGKRPTAEQDITEANALIDKILKSQNK